MEKDTLFEEIEEQDRMEQRPLAFRMRPQTLSDFVGQKHILGKGKLLRRMIEGDCFQSLVFWGPPGCGKNSLASLIALMTSREFVQLSAVEAGTAQLRKVIETASFRLKQQNRRTLLFIDEIHRFNKAQQDLLLPCVEQGDVTLIGATTHNPVFSLIAALRSRSHIFELKSLHKEEIVEILETAFEKEKKRQDKPYSAEESVFHLISEKCGGDARIALNTLEIALLTSENGRITLGLVGECLPFSVIRYDKDESEHYDTISVFIKSMRGSDADAALYWLGKMLKGGEDPVFIARRLAIFASEDIGMADPTALLMAESAMRLTSEIGLPEARIILSHATIYLATAPKSNASYTAINDVFHDMESHGVEDTPGFVKKTPGKKEENYLYAHNYPGGITEQDYRKSQKEYYFPKETGFEATIKKRIGLWRKIKQKRKSEMR